MSHPPSTPESTRGMASLIQSLRNWLDYFVPQGLKRDVELNRRANLLVAFGFMGAGFGLAFSLLYSLIGHYYGALVVIICSSGMMTIPFLLKKGTSCELLAHLINIILILGFTVLCTLEGGLRGHAIAWMVSVPLCSLLLLSNHRMSYVWCGLSVLVTVVFVGIDFAGISLRPTYPARWETLVSAAGYIALVLFMFLLGILFEKNRKRAHLRMSKTLQELEQANQSLARLNQEKNEFLNMAAHDIKNPLGIIIGYAELIRDTPQIDRPDLIEQIDFMIQAAEGARDLVTQLLDVNAIEQGCVTMNLQNCLLEGIVRRIKERNHHAAERKGVRFEVFAAHPEGVVVRADPSALLQILDNLVSNAVKFSSPGATIFLRIHRDAAEGIVEVQDHGPGLSEEDQQKLFHKFIRLSAKPTGGESSHGLGLFIVKKIAETMLGTVYCRSTLGQGATFGVRLPLS